MSLTLDFDDLVIELRAEAAQDGYTTEEWPGDSDLAAAAGPHVPAESGQVYAAH